MNELLRRALFLPSQASTIARELDGLHYLVITITLLGAFLVTIVGAIFVWKYQKRSHARRPAIPSRSLLSIEAVVVVVILGLFILFWVIGFRQFLTLRVPPRDALEIYVTAKKWMWSFSEADGTSSMSVLYVPANRPIKLIMTSRDVIHSFFVPDFRIKQDVLPGRFTTAWFEAVRPGTYQLLCAEFCGTGHSTMRGEVVALAPDDYARWRTARRTHESRELATHGERVAAEYGCLRCHTIDGRTHIGPTWFGLYGQTITMQSGEHVLADESYLTESMMDPMAKARKGFAPIMPTYQGRLSPAQIAALVEYIKSLPHD